MPSSLSSSEKTSSYSYNNYGGQERCLFPFMFRCFLYCSMFFIALVPVSSYYPLSLTCLLANGFPFWDFFPIACLSGIFQYQTPCFQLPIQTRKGTDSQRSPAPTRINDALSHSLLSAINPLDQTNENSQVMLVSYCYFVAGSLGWAQVKAC